MKICVVMLARKFGGAERFYVDLTNGLARRGHDILAISHARSKAALRLDKAANLHCESVRVLGPWDPLAPRKISRLVRAHGSELIQTSLGRAAHLAGQAASRLKVPPHCPYPRLRQPEIFQACRCFHSYHRGATRLPGQPGYPRRQHAVDPQFFQLCACYRNSMQ